MLGVSSQSKLNLATVGYLNSYIWFNKQLTCIRRVLLAEEYSFQGQASLDAGEKPSRSQPTSLRERIWENDVIGHYSIFQKDKSKVILGCHAS